MLLIINPSRKFEEATSLINARIARHIVSSLALLVYIACCFALASRFPPFVLAFRSRHLLESANGQECADRLRSTTLVCNFADISNIPLLLTILARKDIVQHNANFSYQSLLSSSLCTARLITCCLFKSSNLSCKQPH